MNAINPEAASSAYRAAYLRTIEAERECVRTALRVGAKVISFGRYTETGPMVLAVEIPAAWKELPAYAHRPFLGCIVPDDRVGAVQTYIVGRKVTAAAPALKIAEEPESDRCPECGFELWRFEGEMICPECIRYSVDDRDLPE